MVARRVVSTFAFCILLSPINVFARIIGITPITPLPSVISVFSPPVNATYRVSNVSAGINFTVIDKSQLPSSRGLSMTANTCGNVLTPGQSCVIQLTLTTLSPTTITTTLREWAKPTADGTQYPINVQVTSMMNGLLFASAANGKVYVSANQGAGWAPTSTQPNNGNTVNCVNATSQYLYTCSGAALYYTANGKIWSATASPDGSTVMSLFITSSGVLYVGTSNGNLYSSANNGASWTPTSQPDGSAINSVFVTLAGNLYAGTGNGNVYYSNDNGITWAAINGQPDGSAVTSLFVVGATLYAATQNEYVYTSTALTGSGSWNFNTQTVYSLFANASGSVIDAGTQAGYVYSLVTGDKLGFVTNSPITGVFQLLTNTSGEKQNV